MAKELVSLTEYKEYKGLRSTEEDAKLQALIRRVSAFIKQYCGKTFIDYNDTSKIEYFDGVNTPFIFVDEYPILSIDSIELSYDGGKTYEAPLTEYDDYFVNKDVGEVSSNDSTGYFITAGYSSVKPGVSDRSLKISYKGGYIIVPEDLKQAAMDLVHYYRENEYTPRQDFEGFKIENLGFRTGDSSNLPSHIARILGMYREL